MKAVILLALVSASYGFSVPVDKPGEFVPAIGFHMPNQPAGVSPRIVGGIESKPHAHPHQISLQVLNATGDYNHNCGGSIVGADKIITAAHCIKRGNIANLRVVAGEHDLFKIEGTEQFRAVRTATAHPLYNEDTIDYDYAVIRLSLPLTFNKYVSPINLASCEPMSGDCINTGWGVNETNASEITAKLQQVTIPIVSRPKCKALYEEIGEPVTPRMICAGADGKGPCRGDSGGPLVCNGELAGITSFTVFPCAKTKYPAGFANVDAAREWLNSQ